ncbi:MAG: glycosyltransferase [Gemmatimonadales bacterium]|nr:glycosyltransferase [Gemmatimonadales bacterium]
MTGAAVERECNQSYREEIRSIALVGTYVPRRCGIATFTADLARAIAEVGGGARVTVTALNDQPEGYDYPAEVAFEVNQNQLADYRLAADYLNARQVDIVCLQHEYGIFGGPEGSHVLKLLAELRMPVVTTLHTILKNPSPKQKEVVCELAAVSDRLVVMSEMGRRFLTQAYGVDPQTVELIPHGIPDVPFVDPNYYKDQFGVEGRKVVLTFGLLSPDKGVENMIRALPAIVRRHPDVVYVVLGATHPNVRKAAGESYRLGLQRLIRDLDVGDHVIFHERYVELTELCEYLGAADVYVTPYLNEEQVVSGTLAYALGAGKAVVSTPYWYATEMLSNGRGCVVPFGEVGKLADTVIDLLASGTACHAMRKRAYTFSRGSIWSQVARRYLEVFSEAHCKRLLTPRPAIQVLTMRWRIAALPEIKLDHLVRLTDETGVLQHAIHFVPERSHGYCTDDNARALIVASALRRLVADQATVDALIVRYLSFVQHAFDPKQGRFRNQLGYDRRWTERARSPDSHGRAIWALGVAAARLDEERLRAIAAALLRDALPYAEQMPDMRAVAFALLGLDAYLSRLAGERAVGRMRLVLADRLIQAFKREDADDEWPWAEDSLTYANARLPHALLASGRGLEREDMIQMGLKSLKWLIQVQTIDGHFSPIGNRGWYRRGGERARFEQQPIEANALVAACACAFDVTNDRSWLEQLMLGFEWFLGRNDSNAVLYDDASGGCRDGLHSTGASENEGAESTLAWLSVLTTMNELQANGHLGWTREARRLPAESSEAENATTRAS